MVFSGSGFEALRSIQGFKVEVGVLRVWGLSLGFRCRCRAFTPKQVLLMLSGFLHWPVTSTEGLYKFYVSADDSVEFFLDGNLVIQETRCGVHSSLLEEVLSYYQTLNPKPQHFSYHLSSQHPFGVPPSMAHT